jgi:predicted DNA-binding protein (MmcQ/YjbR family)
LTTVDGIELQKVASDFAEGLGAVEMEHRSGPDWDLFKVRGKVFMLMTDLPGRPVVILKADPNGAVELRNEFADITVGYHMSKTHWITLEGGGNVDEKLLKELVSDSYRLVVRGLSKSEQQMLGTSW